ncbi:dihydrolipoyl dehydrogenase family protein [Nesterenkonia jeotgali]|uniref:Pyridine nucleotide-disulfide oxidoreductase n=1 Tax=Nesterenkonia jeotgali TaxID=317018 RepID=A0A0W8IBB5_9MICC|nr:NAD(P)/FAD-dependent oxidoreductase [Nesterenkonia jeotgali]KUG57260.1 pyridine nucleotide-disulfide oxidoreductase [Nesterenkonia jeotgali]
MTRKHEEPEKYDLMVIGAGMAGIAAATKCASQGWRVAIVDSLPYGGTCALRGCDPKKILRRGAEILEAAHLMGDKGIGEGGLSVNWAQLMKHKHGFTDGVPASMEDGLKTHGVQTLHGTAVFTGPTEVEVSGVGYHATKILIATGATPVSLDFPGHEHLIDSTAFLNLESLPPRVLFVGGGFVSFEFAHIAARAGSRPIIIDRGSRPLKGFDPDLVDLLVRRGAECGVDVQSGTSMTGVEETPAGYQVHLQQQGVASMIEVDLVVHGAGRVPDLSRLDLEAGGVAYGPGGIDVSADLQSVTNSAVYAAGDAADTEGMPLTPVAVLEAKVAASNILKSGNAVPDYAGTPTAVFTIPELVRVGVLEDEAQARGMDIEVRYTDTSRWFSQYRVGETAGAVKILVDRSSDRIVGAHLFGHGVAELVNTISLAMKYGLTARELRSSPAVYPSVGSDLGSML